MPVEMHNFPPHLEKPASSGFKKKSEQNWFQKMHFLKPGEIICEGNNYSAAVSGSVEKKFSHFVAKTDIKLNLFPANWQKYRFENTALRSAKRKEESEGKVKHPFLLLPHK